MSAGADAAAGWARPSEWNLPVRLRRPDGNVENFDTVRIKLDDILPPNWGTLREIVAADLSDRFQEEFMIDTSRVRVIADDRQVHYQDSIPVEFRGTMVVEIVPHDWQDTLHGWPDDKVKKFFLELAMTPADDAPDQTCSSTSEFAEMVKNADALWYQRLRTRSSHTTGLARGTLTEDEQDEILQTLQAHIVNGRVRLSEMKSELAE